MSIHMLQICVFCQFPSLIGHMEQQIEAAEIVIINDVCNLLLLKEHYLVYGVRKGTQEATFFETQQDFVPQNPFAGFVDALRHCLVTFAIVLPSL
jgi:hypothetical protein